MLPEQPPGIWEIVPPTYSAWPPLPPADRMQQAIRERRADFLGVIIKVVVLSAQNSHRSFRFILVVGLTGLYAQDARDILRKSVDLDQTNWLRMKDYTSIAHRTERHLDSSGNVKSADTRAWEKEILYGGRHRRMLENTGKPLPPAELRKEQEKVTTG